MVINITLNNQTETSSFGKTLGILLKGGQLVELVGDVGAGKTTLTKAIASGLGVSDAIVSPTFTISNQYEARDDLRLIHYDFYRLQDAGILRDELEEVVHDSRVVTIIEWGNIVSGVLPEDRVTLRIVATGDESRQVTATAGGVKSRRILMELGR